MILCHVVLAAASAWAQDFDTPPDLRFSDMAQDADGGIWAITKKAENDIFRLVDGAWEEEPIARWANLRLGSGPPVRAGHASPECLLR